MTHSVIHTRQVVAKFSEYSADGTLSVIEFGAEDKMKRGVSTTLKCLGVTLVCVCIPGAHFILVPLSLLVAPFIVIAVARVKTKIMSSQLQCPKCKAVLDVLSTKENYPLIENCSGCHRAISIMPVAPG